MHDQEFNEIRKFQLQILEELESLKYGDPEDKPTFGQRLADIVVSFLGSWKFIIILSTILIIWVLLNAWWLANVNRFDPYPFILLNLALSFQAAYASPLILMAQKRSEEKDRRKAVDAYRSIENIESMMSLLREKIKNGKNGKYEEKND